MKKLLLRQDNGFSSNYTNSTARVPNAFEKNKLLLDAEYESKPRLLIQMSPGEGEQYKNLNFFTALVLIDVVV